MHAVRLEPTLVCMVMTMLMVIGKVIVMGMMITIMTIVMGMVTSMVIVMVMMITIMAIALSDH